MTTGKPAIPATVLGSLYDSENSDSVPAKPPDRVLKVTEEQGAQGGRHSRAESWAEGARPGRAVLLHRGKAPRPPRTTCSEPAGPLGAAESGCNASGRAVLVSAGWPDGPGRPAGSLRDQDWPAERERARGDRGGRW